MIAGWLTLFGASLQAFLLEPNEGHGLWNGREIFGTLPRQLPNPAAGPVAVLTRATIRVSRAADFWRHVPAVASQMAGADGFMTSYGIGEIPFFKQATFSIWQSRAQMQQFAYRMQEHREVVRKTRSRKWYSEDMFMRFRILRVWNVPEVQQFL